MDEDDDHFISPSDEIAQDISAGKYKHALPKIQAILEKEPDNIGILLDAGYVYSNLEIFDKAIEAYAKVEQLAPDSASGSTGLAFVYRMMGNNQKAIDFFQKASKIAPDNAMVHFELAETLFEENMYEEALKSYYKAIQFGGGETEVETLHRIAQAHLGLEDPDKAIEVAKNVLDRDPKYGSIYNVFGIAAYMKENWQEATDYLKKYLALVPDDEYAQNVLKEVQEKLEMKPKKKTSVKKKT